MQMEAAVHYDTLMNLGHVDKTFEIDYSNCESNEGIFHIEVRPQPDVLEEESDEPAKVTMRFHAQFEHY